MQQLQTMDVIAKAIADAGTAQWVGYLDHGLTQPRDLPCGCLQLSQGRTVRCDRHRLVPAEVAA